MKELSSSLGLQLWTNIAEDKQEDSNKLREPYTAVRWRMETQDSLEKIFTTSIRQRHKCITQPVGIWEAVKAKVTA